MIGWVNVENCIDRLEELREFLRNFPDSKLVPAVKSEIAFLEKLVEVWG